MPEPRSNRSWFQRLTDKVRGSGVGTEDPNVVGDAGPFDKAPGRDQPEGIEVDTPRPGDEPR